VPAVRAFGEAARLAFQEITALGLALQLELMGRNAQVARRVVAEEVPPAQRETSRACFRTCWP